MLLCEVVICYDNMQLSCPVYFTLSGKLRGVNSCDLFCFPGRACQLDDHLCMGVSKKQMQVL